MPHTAHGEVLPHHGRLRHAAHNLYAPLPLAARDPLSSQQPHLCRYVAGTSSRASDLNLLLVALLGVQQALLIICRLLHQQALYALRGVAGIPYGHSQ